jgi:hypothetical protein
VEIYSYTSSDIFNGLFYCTTLLRFREHESVTLQAGDPDMRKQLVTKVAYYENYYQRRVARFDWGNVYWFETTTTSLTPIPFHRTGNISGCVFGK